MLKIGENGSYSKQITAEDIQAFANLVGDTNSIHLDEEVARARGYKDRIAHGMLTGSLISTVLGTVFPGEGTIYLEQNLKFLKAVYEGEICTARVFAEDVLKPDKGIYRLRTDVVNESGETVIDGFAIIKYID